MRKAGSPPEGTDMIEAQVGSAVFALLGSGDVGFNEFYRASNGAPGFRQ